MTGRKVVIILLTVALLVAMAAPALMAAPTPRPTMKAGPAATVAPTARPASQNNVMSALQSRADMSTFVSDINKVGLQDTLNSGGPYTIFVPTNNAFGSLPAVKANIVNQDNLNLGYTLKYHVAQGKFTEAQLKNMNYMVTLNSRAVPVKMAGNNIMIDGATITGPGVEVGNSIIYPVDAVIVPPMLTA